MALGKISGQMLRDNLTREGVDLAFETDLLYLDVINNRVGIKNSNPQYTLDVTGTLRTTTANISNSATISSINISGDTISSSTSNITLGSGDDVVYQNKAVIDDITIENNSIITNNGNKNLELGANGTGVVDILSDTNISGNLHVIGDITTQGNLIVGDQITDTLTINARINSDIIPETTNTYNIGSLEKSWNNLYTTNIKTNTISAFTNDTDLTITTGGSGNVFIEQLGFSNSTITGSGNITITPESGYLIIDSTSSMQIPNGTTLQRPTSQTGQIRFNTELNIFEGYNGSDWIQLNGVIDLDGDTFVTAELTPGANDNTIRFTVGGTVVASVDSEKLNTSRIDVGNVSVQNNTISNTVTDQDLNIITTGSSSVIINSFNISNNIITNTISNSVTVFENTNSGYIKFDGTNGFVIPLGNTSQRPASPYVETGMMRYNTDDKRVEIYDGIQWIGIGGIGAGINRSDAETIAFETIMLLG